MDTVENNNLQNNQAVSPKQIARNDSYFDGNTWQLIGYRILSALVNTITLGIAYPWMLCMVQRWEVKHTVIHGRRLKFNGHGHQLIGKYLLWVFLTIITFGIYGIWLGLGMKKWVVRHTVYADEERPVDSYFSGGAGGYLGIHILQFALTLFTLGIGKAWADKMVLKWEAKHTHIGGSPLEFNGTGGQLFVKYLLLALLTPLTLGIYALFFTVIYIKWQIKHTEAVYQTPEIQAKAKSHEMTAVQDFAKYRIAANDQEIAAMKSGYTGKEDKDTLERLAEEGNPFAAYHLAKQLKGENAVYEGRDLELLQKAADSKVHSALLDLAKQSPTEQKVSMLTEAAQCGNAEASWLLAVEYQKNADLAKAAYWFKVALEWGVADAKASTDEYDEIVKNISLQLSENRVMSKPSKALPIVIGIVGAVVLLAGIALLLGVRGMVYVNPETGEEVIIDSIFSFIEYKFGGASAVADNNMTIQNIAIMQSKSPDAIEGKHFTLTGSDGRKYEYILNENLFFDREEHILYFEFAYVSEDVDLFLYTGDWWKTERIPGSGVFMVDYPDHGISSEYEIAVAVDDGSQYGDTLKYHTVDIYLGTTAEAEAWLANKYDTEPEADLVNSIVGGWAFYDRYTHSTTGEDTLEIWEYTFNSDGTYSLVHRECIAVEPGRGSIYYDGTVWRVPSASSEDGTYKLIDTSDNVVLSMSCNYSTDPDASSFVTTECYVYLDGNSLTLQGDGWSRTLTRN